MSTPRFAAGLAALALVGVAGATRDARPPADSPPPSGTAAVVTSSVAPARLSFTESGDETKDRHLFNDFSWRAFVALNWPATGTGRGTADVSKSFGDAAVKHVVWGTWKSLDELFPPDPDTTPPTKWESFEAELRALRPNKGVAAAGRKRILTQAGRLGTVFQAGLSSHRLPPLVAQNRTYVRYETRVNETAYNFIRDNRYYLGDEIRKAVDAKKDLLTFPDGSIVVKVAWMELTGVAKADRFYQVEAEIDDAPPAAAAAQLRTATVGLVGFHITSKIPAKPSWVWTTFEHVDNTEPGPRGHPASFSNNDPALLHDRNSNVDRKPAVPDITLPLPANPDPVDV